MKNIKKITVMMSMVVFALSCKCFADTGTVKIEATRVREKPNTESEIITSIYEDDKVNIVGYEGEWCKIQYDGKTGYVKKDFLNIEKSNNETPKTTVNTSNKVVLRLQPNLNSKVIGEVVLEGITKINEFNNWEKYTDGNITGWVSKVKMENTLNAKQEILRQETTVDEKIENPEPKEEPKEEPKQETNTSKVGKINVETANLRQKASSDSTIIECLDYNDEVTILSEKGDWYKIKKDDMTGYVSKKLITVGVSSRSMQEVRELKDDTIIDESDTLESGESQTESKTAVVDFAKQYLGYPYVLGGRSPETGFDCSGFTKYVYSNFGQSLGATATSQTSNGTEVSRENLVPGDLILFYDEGKTKIGHTGIYMGDGNFIHAANPQRGVVTDNLNSNSYYNTRFVTARRIVN